MNKSLEEKILTFQYSEITEHYIYEKLARATKHLHNKEVIRRISEDELNHYNILKNYTKKEVSPNKLKVWIYYITARIFGLTFGVKLMERGEQKAQLSYDEIKEEISEIKKIIEEEDEHENELINLIDEERLKYVGSIVLGLNDALVELTGAIAGFTLALQEANLIATAALITGISASLSMGATEYLSTKSEKTNLSPAKSAIYTGSAYILTVAFLVFPYLVFSNVYISLSVMLTNAIIIIFIFNFYISVAKEVSFIKKFSEMAALSLGIAALSFLLGYVIKNSLAVEV